MIQYDCHVHTSFSSDSKTPVRDQIERAVSLGLKGICITDHMDLDFPNIERSGGMTFVFDVPEYIDEMMKVREEYRDRADILIGMEAGLRNEPECIDQIERYRQLADSYPFDFIIGSTHCLEFTDPYYESPYWDGRTVREGILNYFRAVDSNVDAYDCFDSVGHLDYLIRYVPAAFGFDPSADYRISDYSDVIDSILRKIIHKGIALEVNTAGHRHNLGFAHPHDDVLKRYRELGGELVTIGSDGHKPEFLGLAFDSTCEMLKSIGFRYQTVFKERRPVSFAI